MCSARAGGRDVKGRPAVLQVVMALVAGNRGEKARRDDA